MATISTNQHLYYILKRVSFGDTLKNYFKKILGLIFNMEHILRKVNVEGSASPFS